MAEGPESLVVALCGLPGAGKSTLATHLLDELPLRVVNRDTIRQAQFPLCAFSGDEKRAANQAARAAVVANCRLGFSSLIDGMTFSTRGQRFEFARLVHAEQARFVVLYLDCPADIAASRLKNDNSHPAGDRRQSLVNDVAKRFEPPDEEALRIDASAPVETVRTLAFEAVSHLLHAVDGSERDERWTGRL